MDKFPLLTNWFRFVENDEIEKWKIVNDWYYYHNDCSFFTLLWKQWADKDYFIKEIVKLIARIRWNNIIEVSPWKKIDFSSEFIKYIDTWACILNNDQKKDYINRIMSLWIRSKEWNFDLIWARGHFWEIMYYLIRIQYLKDKKIEINVNTPKRYSKEPWLDFTEIREDNEWLYLIIGEIKSTKNAIWNYPSKIIDQLNINHKTTFLEHDSFYKDKVKNWLIKDEKLKDFITYLWNFSSISSCNFRSNKKRFSWMINYWNNSKPSWKIFSNFKTSTISTLSDEIECRKVKLIWINNIDDILEKIYKLIFIDFLK